MAAIGHHEPACAITPPHHDAHPQHPHRVIVHSTIKTTSSWKEAHKRHQALNPISPLSKYAMRHHQQQSDAALIPVKDTHQDAIPKAGQAYPQQHQGKGINSDPQYRTIHTPRDQHHQTDPYPVPATQGQEAHQQDQSPNAFLYHAPPCEDAAHYDNHEAGLRQRQHRHASHPLAPQDIPSG